MADGMEKGFLPDGPLGSSSTQRVFVEVIQTGGGPGPSREVKGKESPQASVRARSESPQGGERLGAVGAAHAGRPLCWGVGEQGDPVLSLACCARTFKLRS